MRIMGIDPGTLKMGVGVIEHDRNERKALFYRTLSIKGTISLHVRLQRIYKEICALIATWHPDVIALEDVYYGINFKSAIRIGEARCAVILAAGEQHIAVEEYSPTQVKSAVCGFGRASKVQIQNMIQRILSLNELPQSDTADALALAICHSNKMSGA